ncbi:MAG: radical SAM family heme chaperone HemW [Chitinophagales bacterium]
MKAGLYIHIPFCTKACHYCAFYFVTSESKKIEFINALLLEIERRSNELVGFQIETIYFGGGTPSLLTIPEFTKIFEKIYTHYQISPKAEITIESNPENLNAEYIEGLKTIGVNRLSIGVQSFFDEDLSSMNRSHKASEALKSIQEATKIIDNVSIDLMFGLPYSGMNSWKENLKIATKLGVQHISTYNLTVEEKTYLARKVKRKEVKVEADKVLNEMYFFTLDYLGSKEYVNYEISNFGKEAYFSRHNLGYWMGTPYIGFGPSAHSYLIEYRRSNRSNLNEYIKSIFSDLTYWDVENLSQSNKYNEYVLTRLRHYQGVNTAELKEIFGSERRNYFVNIANDFVSKNLISESNEKFFLTNTGKVLADLITSELMII